MKTTLNKIISLVLSVAMLTTTSLNSFASTISNLETTSNPQISVAQDSTYRLIIKYKDEKKKVNFEKFNKNLKSKNIKSFEFKESKKNSNIDIIEVSSNNGFKSVVDELQKQENVLYVQEDYKLNVSNNTDPYLYQQWAIKNVGQEIAALKGKLNIDTYAIESWEKSKGNKNIPIAILDTGIDINHEDLKENIFKNKNEIPNNGVDDDTNGYIDDVNGWNFYDNTNVVFSESGDIHGTHIAGIIGAKENALGIVGAAPETQILPLKFIGSDGGYTSAVIEAIAYAKKMGVKIVNCSWGSTQYNQALEYEMKNSGLLFICAAGNKSSNNDLQPYFPASFNLPNIISVGALDNQGLLSSFSNYGTSVSIAAPGTSIYSTYPDNKYGFLSGTSMAAPFVTAVASQLSSISPSIKPNEIKESILNYSVVNQTLEGKIYNSRVLNAYGSLFNTSTIIERDNLNVSDLPVNTNTTVKDNGDDQKDFDFKIVSDHYPNQLRVWQQKQIDNNKYIPQSQEIDKTISPSKQETPVETQSLLTSNYKLKPKLLETNFNAYMSAATVTTSSNSLDSFGNFRTNKDLAGMSWYSTDTTSHPYLKYSTDPDFSSVKLSYDYSINGYIEPMNAVAGPALTIETNSGEYYYVRLWNYVVNRPLEDWEIGASEYLDQEIRFPINRTIGLDNGVQGRIEIDFSNLYSGWSPYQWTSKISGHDSDGKPIYESAWTEDPNWVKVPTDNIKRIMWTFVPQNYDFSNNPINYLQDSMPYKVTFSNWNVTGNVNLGDEPQSIPKTSIGISDDYDDIYNLTPERVVSDYSKLGFGGNVDFYIGASHYYDKKYNEGVMQLISEYPFNAAFEGWYKNYLGFVKNNGLNIIHSISMESLDAPYTWWQKTWDGSPSETGWTPATHLLSFTNSEVKSFYKKYVEALVDLSSELSMTPIIQLGEPWWWYNDFSSSNSPCFYDMSTRELYLSETGQYMHEFHSIYDDISGYEDMLTWLGNKNGEFSLFLKDVIKQKNPNALFTVLFFPPSVLDKERVPLMMGMVNFPKNHWRSPNLDFFMLEDYDYLITNQMDKHDEALEFIKHNLGYSNDKIHYLSGFVLNDSQTNVWSNIEQALNDGISHNFAANYIWAYAQVKRDGWHIPNLIKASSPSGNYTNPVEITLSNPDGYDIYYTLNENAPDLYNSSKYTAPIHIEEDTVIQASIMKNGTLVSETKFSYNFSLKGAITTDIVIDAKDSDWNKIASSSVGSGKVFDLSLAQDETNLYMLARGSSMNTDSNFYIDIDKNENTGMKVWTWSLSGADYMVANNGLFKYVGNGQDWNWQYISEINSAKNSNTVEVSVPLSLMGQYNQKILQVGFGSAYTDFAPSVGNNLAVATTSILGENSYLNPGEEYLSYLLAETGASLNGNDLTYNGKIYQLTQQNSRVINNRIIVNANEFADFITPPTQIHQNLLALRPNDFIDMVVASIDEGNQQSLMVDEYLTAASYGQYNSNVKRIQIALQKLGYLNPLTNKATGYFGEATKQALINFEKNTLQLSDEEADYINGEFISDYNEMGIQTASTTKFTGSHEFISAKLDEAANGKTVNPLTIGYNFVLGMGDAAIETAKGIYGMVTEMDRTIEGFRFIIRATIPGSEENEAMKQILKESVSKCWNDFSNGDLNVKARYVGRLVGEILLCVIGGASASLGLKAIKASSKSGKLVELLSSIGKGTTKADDAVRALKTVAEAISINTGRFVKFLDKIEAETWGNRIFKSWENGLTSAERQAIYDYTTDAYYPNINNVLRGIESSYAPGNAARVEQITNALNKATIADDIVVYRGVGRDALGAFKDLPNNQLVGKVLEEKAFMSTSLVPEGSFSKPITYVIKVPQGSKGAFIENISMYGSDEVELLLNRGQKMVIQQVIEEGSNTKLVMELLP